MTDIEAEIAKVEKIVAPIAQAAADKARLHGTKLVVKRDGKIITQTPDEFEAQ